MAETIDARTGTPCLKFDIEVFAETRMKETRQRMAHVVKYSPPPPSEGIAPCTVNGKDALKSSGGTQIAPDPTNPLGRGVVTVDPAGASA
jgi:hypothetical protein